MRSTSLNIVVVHGAYQHRGGEDSVVESEVAMLRARGHHVTLVARDNHEIDTSNPFRLTTQTISSTQTTREFRALVGAHDVDLVHVHNTFPLISPSIYWAAADAGIPVVQTLHNFRLLCPQAMFLRENKVCQDCLGKVPWRGVVRGCYRGSVAGSAVLAGMLTVHRALGTWSSKVTRFIALNEFCRDKFIEGGLPADRIVVKPNFVSDVEKGFDAPRHGLLYVGRLSTEKGIEPMAKAAAQLPMETLTVIGTGPQTQVLEPVIPPSRMLGVQQQSSVMEWMRKSIALVVPSIWFENFPRTIVEAYANGLPVIASRIGALEGLVEDGVTGLLVQPGDPEDLAEKMRWAVENPGAMAEMGQRARVKFEGEYSESRNYRLLERIYAEAIEFNRVKVKTLPAHQ